MGQRDLCKASVIYISNDLDERTYIQPEAWLIMVAYRNEMRRDGKGDKHLVIRRTNYSEL